MQLFYNLLLLIRFLRGNFRGIVRHKVVLVEGNYLLLEEGEWIGLQNLFDERWYGSTYAWLSMIKHTEAVPFVKMKS